MSKIQTFRKMFPKISKNFQKASAFGRQKKVVHRPAMEKAIEDWRNLSKMNSYSPKMAQEIQKLQKDISKLMEESKRIQNSNNIPECLKNIQ